MMNVKETAKQIRKELKEKFPFTKFSVRCERSGSINVRWTDFPTEKAVEEIVSKYEQVQRCEATGEILSGGNLFVFTRQEWTEEMKKKIIDEMHNNYGESYLNDRACWYRAFNETAEKLYNEFLQTLETKQEAKQEQHTDVKATYTLNDELNGIEITFTCVPSEEIRNELKANGFRWSKYKKVWYAKQTVERLEFAKMLASETEQQTEEVTEQSETRQKLIQTKETEKEHNTQQAEERQEAQQQIENKEQPQKIKVKSITFLWSESPVIKDNTTVSTWEEANKIIKDVAFRIDKGYDKTAFFIEWEDGRTYKGRIDVMAKDYYKESPLSEHIYNFALGMAGIKKPFSWTDEEYESYLNGLNVDREVWKELIDSYMLHDEETTKSPHDPYDHVGNNRDNGVTTIVAEEAQPLQETLFYHEALTEAQNAKINEILNRHKNSNRFTFVAVYQRQNEAKQAVLHVLDENKKDLYLSILLDGTVAFSERYLGFYDRDIKLLHEFTNNSDNVQELNDEQEEKAVNNIIQEAENTNNTNETHKLDILQEQNNHDTIQEETKKLNNTLATESLEDLQSNNDHNTNEVESLQVSYKINDEKNGIELYFSDKPNEAIREQLKRMGFKWSRLGFWYAKKTDERLQFVLSLLSDSYNSELTEEQRKTLSKRLEKDNVKPLRLFKAKNSDSVLLECINTNLADQKPFYFLIRSNGEEIGKGYDSDILNDYTLIYTYAHNSEQESEPVTYPNIDINDIHTYVIDKKLQEAENSGHWIFRSKEFDHTKSIQNFFSQYNDKVVEVLEQTDNERIKYHLKKALQTFKKRYFDNYVKRLRNKADNPSIWVTGRSGRNISRYNKLLNRYDKLMQEAIELTKQMDRAIERAKDEIRRDKEQRIKEAVKNVKNDLTFRVVTKEVEYMGYKQRKRVYIYGDYWTAKLWNAYRIFKGGQEIYALKTTQGLEDAKQYIAYLVQQEQEKAKNVITA